MAPKKPLERLKTSVMARTLALTRLTVSAGARAAGHAVGNLFVDDESRLGRAKEMMTAQLTALASELGQLKGSAMKAGQMLSMFGEQFLPPEANALLKSLQSDSPPMAWEAIEKVLLEEIGTAKLQDLDIERTPTAAASLGQVHVARRLSDGKKLAIKIQYPGVEGAIASDLRVMRRLLSLTRLLPKGIDCDGLFAEMKQMLEQEADYTQELQQTQWFNRALHKDKRYVIPEPVESLSSRHVLTTSFEAGVGVDSDAVKALSQARRNALGLAALDLYMRELWEFGRVQTDPHFGNYRVRLDPQPEAADQLVALDFGATRAVPPLYLQGYRDLVTGACRRDAEQVLRGGRTLGFLVTEPEPASEKLFVDLCSMITEPFNPPTAESAHLFDAHGCYDWGRSDLPKRLARRGTEAAMTFKLRAPPRESLFLDRKLGGMFIFLAALRVNIAGREVVARYLSID
jgi:predicted unusual protein kinase regulating ubiquinone biosynthesis (AarF/ABC1/UbiB family)